MDKVLDFCSGCPENYLYIVSSKHGFLSVNRENGDLYFDKRNDPQTNYLFRFAAGESSVLVPGPIGVSLMATVTHPEQKLFLAAVLPSKEPRLGVRVVSGLRFDPDTGHMSDRENKEFFLGTGKAGGAILSVSSSPAKYELLPPNKGK